MDDWYMKITNAEDEADMTGLPSWKPTPANEYYSEFAYVLSLFILIAILIFPLILIHSKRNMQSRSSTMLVGDDASTEITHLYINWDS
uniref:Serine rich and transmembrane domain containing 1 n=1 Tax=Heterorhabditis bacteriophora TaxID=37862 RepID=A0A1I7X2F7_HETBA